jgi:predicted TIM-barrel fold metal-dependent hydrolase
MSRRIVMVNSVEAVQPVHALRSGSEHAIVVSCDSHVGPRLVQDLRSYCPKKYLDDYDTFVEGNKDAFAKARDGRVGVEHDDTQGASTEAAAEARRREIVNSQTAGHYDVHARLKDMDWDGVAAEVIFHGSQNEEAFPFAGIREARVTLADQNLELLYVGYHLYNRWLSDFVSVAPERHVGLAYLPMWDVDLAIKEVEWAAGAGLRGVNFPAPKPGIAEYDDPVWERFWAACEELGMMLATHIGVATAPRMGPQWFAINVLENIGWPSRRGMHRLIFGGVFERYPKLKLILTEQARGWWTYSMGELDRAYGVPTKALRAQVPKKPSEYMTSNVFLGASFMGPATVDEAVREGYTSNVLWGSDYPHGEGTYKYPEFDGEPSMGRQYLRWAFADCPTEFLQPMLGDNGITAYDLDRDALVEVAARIGPTIDEITTPLGVLPEGWHDDILGQ